MTAGSLHTATKRPGNRPKAEVAQWAPPQELLDEGVVSIQSVNALFQPQDGRFARTIVPQQQCDNSSRLCRSA